MLNRFSILLLLLLTGCGFHLKHSLALERKFPKLVVVAANPPPFYEATCRALQAASVHLFKTPSQDTPRLSIDSYDITSQPLVYGYNGELRRERLKLSVFFTISHPSIQQFELTVERERQLTTAQLLGDNAERELIEEEMRADIIEQLLNFLSTYPL